MTVEEIYACSRPRGAQENQGRAFAGIAMLAMARILRTRARLLLLTSHRGLARYLRRGPRGVQLNQRGSRVLVDRIPVLPRRCRPAYVLEPGRIAETFRRRAGFEMDCAKRVFEHLFALNRLNFNGANKLK